MTCAVCTIFKEMKRVREAIGFKWSSGIRNSYDVLWP